ncbi:hypothetical protein ACQ33O_02655 [Ferruginibacter sp. SUN002]|uniref:hypothetical protein n=1 Tax=Ferruginibacter sp. SUN002 TaxID=2937789 RepID=UPI003D368FC3
MKYLFILSLILTVSCNRSLSEKIKDELSKHIEPKDSVINKMKIGETFVLESSEVEGIDRERYKEFDYWKEIDTNYFKYVASKEFSDPEMAGGSSTTLEIQKAIKAGYTEVKFYKRKYYGNKAMPDSIKRDTASILYNTYKFEIK